MSWSLQLHSGDFVLSNSRLSTVTNEQKLVQDLRCALLERMGTDDMHIGFGSLLDGGTMPDGTVVPGLIGSSDLQRVAHSIETEIKRIASSYQNQQLTRAKNDRLTYNRVSLSPAEVLITVTHILMEQVSDVLMVKVGLATAQGVTIDAVFPISSTG